jgi:D-beta-D-heptose 7-phosphate kinase / D-beta-D-heptose 1-phosphate adenosyltransferase
VANGSVDTQSGGDTPLGQLMACLGRLPQARVVCIGDVMLDRFVRGSVERISPEAPIQVLRVANEDVCLGGVGNVARNLAALGVPCRLISVLGDDREAGELRDALARAAGVESQLIVEPGRSTTTKTRCVVRGQQLLRIDRESTRPVTAETVSKILEACAAWTVGVPVVVVSDYQKGVLVRDVVGPLIERANVAGAVVIVDPKGTDYSAYRGASLVTPNRHELALATDRPVATLEQVAEAAQALIDRYDFQAVCATLSEEGMMLVRSGCRPVHHPTEAHEVFDVSGAGDTVVAMLAAAIGVGADYDTAVELANVAAGIVVGKVGTAVVSPPEVAQRIRGRLGSTGTKLMQAAEAAQLAAIWRAQGLTVGFTNGCFDLLHPGHCMLLEKAAAQVDRLVVGLNSDSSVRMIKGPQRPIQNENSRAAVLASLQSVSLVVIFDTPTPEALIEAMRPDVLFKGSDYTVDQVVGGDLVKAHGGRVVLIDLDSQHSTTRLVERASATRPPEATL